MRQLLSILILCVFLNYSHGQVLKTEEQKNVAGISFVLLGGGIAWGVANHFTDQSLGTYGTSYAMMGAGIVGFKISIFDRKKARQRKKIRIFYSSQ